MALGQKVSQYVKQSFEYVYRDVNIYLIPPDTLKKFHKSYHNQLVDQVVGTKDARSERTSPVFLGRKD